MKYSSPEKLLKYLNDTYSRLHTTYEKAFWISYMGIKDVEKEKNIALAKRDAFNSNKKLKAEVERNISKAKGESKKRLGIWLKFFNLYQIPDHAVEIRKRASEIESRIHKTRGERKEGYIDPKTKEFVEASENRMRTLMRTHDDEAVRKACFEAMEKLPLVFLTDYVEAIKVRNEYARALGYTDFYDYKIHLDEGISKDELFKIFEKVYKKTKYGFDGIRILEKDMPGLRKPWNFGYMFSGNFVKEEDSYFQFENALMYWGKSFSTLGIDFKKGRLMLDLMDRKGKWNNGFCHYPVVTTYKNNKFIPGEARFTSNTVSGQIGAGIRGIETLFHEAGHAADRLNSIQKDVCLNTEYPPSTVSWSETQSMFMDTISSSIEWKTRYAVNKEGKYYPFDLFERKLQKLYPNRPLDMMSTMFIMEFEKLIYEEMDLNEDKVLEIARKTARKYMDRSEDTILALNVPHIYTWESSAYYHGYGLAKLGVAQWREYFFKKYGYIVDNQKVGKEMEKVWKFGSLYSSRESIRIATGKDLSADAYIREVTMPIEQILNNAKKRIAVLEKIPKYHKPVKLNAKITLTHGKKVIADNSKSFEDMDLKFKKWLKTLEK